MYQTVPSSSKNKLGSIPSAPSITIGSDQGPSGLSAVTKKFPILSTCVQIQ